MMRNIKKRLLWRNQLCLSLHKSSDLKTANGMTHETSERRVLKDECKTNSQRSRKYGDWLEMGLSIKFCGDNFTIVKSYCTHFTADNITDKASWKLSIIWFPFGMWSPSRKYDESALISYGLPKVFIFWSFDLNFHFRNFELIFYFRFTSHHLQKCLWLLYL